MPAFVRGVHGGTGPVVVWAADGVAEAAAGVVRASGAMVWAGATVVGTTGGAVVGTVGASGVEGAAELVCVEFA